MVIFKQMKWNYDNPCDFIQIELLAFIGRFRNFEIFLQSRRQILAQMLRQEDATQSSSNLPLKLKTAANL